MISELLNKYSLRVYRGEENQSLMVTLYKENQNNRTEIVNEWTINR